MKPFSVIIPTFNDRTYKRFCLPTVLTAISASADVIEEVVVVDNGSTDGGFSYSDLQGINLTIRLEEFLPTNRRAARFPCRYPPG